MSQSGKELDEFLKEQGSRGVIDSSGEFTINVEKAQMKLGASRFTDVGFWILKLVQFGATNKALEMEVVMEQRVTRATLLFDMDDLHFADLLSALQEPEPERSAKFHHLIVAMRALSGSEDHRFALHFGQSCLLWNGSELGTGHLEESEVTPGLTLEVTADSKGLSRGVARRVRETRLLATSAVTAPFPIVLDGRPIDLFAVEPSGHYSQLIDIDFDFDEAPTSPERLQALRRLPAALSSLAAHLDCASNRQFALRVERHPVVSAFWFLNYNYEVHHRPFSFSPYPKARPKPSYVYLTKDGVILETHKFGKSFPFSIHLFLCGDAASTDISECNFRKDAAYRELCSRIPYLLGRANEHLDQKLSGLEKLGQGRVLGGWDVVKGTAQHLLKGLSVGRWIADKGGRYCSLPLFRKKLLLHIKVQRVNLIALSRSEPTLIPFC